MATFSPKRSLFPTFTEADEERLADLVDQWETAFDADNATPMHGNNMACPVHLQAELTDRINNLRFFKTKPFQTRCPKCKKPLTYPIPNRCPCGQPL